MSTWQKKNECNDEIYSTTMKKKTGGVEHEFLKICQYEKHEDQTVK